MIDKHLADTLVAFLLNHRISRKLVSGYNAPLGTFSARINAAFSLGPIDKHEHHECQMTRRVRNRFAHSVHGLTFKDEEIWRLCLKLQSSTPDEKESFEENSRFLFINATILIVLRLTYRAE